MNNQADTSYTVRVKPEEVVAEAFISYFLSDTSYKLKTAVVSVTIGIGVIVASRILDGSAAEGVAYKKLIEQLNDQPKD